MYCHFSAYSADKGIALSCMGKHIYLLFGISAQLQEAVSKGTAASSGTSALLIVHTQDGFVTRVRLWYYRHIR